MRQAILSQATEPVVAHIVQRTRAGWVIVVALVCEEFEETAILNATSLQSYNMSTRKMQEGCVRGERLLTSQSASRCCAS